MADVAAAIEGAADRLEAPTVGVLGLSVGGYLALRVAAAHPARIDRVVAVYPGWVDTADNPLGDGVRLADALPGLQVPALAIAGARDTLVRGTSASLLGAAAAPPRARVVPRAEHGFLARHRPSHDAEAAEEAWGLILKALA